MRRHTLLLLGLLAALPLAAPLLGCATRLPVEAAAPPVASGSASEASEAAYAARYARVAEAMEEEERHHANVFLGYTWERGEGGATIGLDYLRRIDRRLQVGPFVDVVAGDVDALAFGVILLYEACPGLFLAAGPGVDLSREEDHDGHGHGDLEAAALFRLGVSYEAELGRGWTIGPAFFLDLIAPKKQAYVLGLNVAKNW